MAAGGARPSASPRPAIGGLMRGQRVVIPGLANKLLAALAPRFVPRRILLAQLHTPAAQARKPALKRRHIGPCSDGLAIAHQPDRS